jgi:hypothetical protein
VAAEELGGAVNDNVRTEGQRLLQQWSGEGVVDRDKSAAVTGRGAQSGQVGDVELRVGR